MRNTILNLLKDAAELVPDRIALEDEWTSITYAEYAQSAKTVGTYLIKEVTEGEVQFPIAVLIDRNVQSVIAFIGALYAGCFYVPIDPLMPEERLQKMLTELNPACILDARVQKNDLNLKSVPIDSILKETEPDEDLVGRVADGIIDTDPAYALFTSGSTGIPKGVLVAHRSVIDLTEAFEESFAFEDGSVFGNQAPFDFDVSVKDLYNALKCHGTVCIIPRRFFAMPRVLIEYLTEKKISTLIWAVSILRIIADFDSFNCGVKIPLIRDVMFSGEVLPVKALNYWMHYMPNTRFVNLYGPTEITCNCTYYIIDRKFEPTSFIPIGKAFSNCRVFLLNEEGQKITEPGKIGEICVEGSCLALGYYNNPEKTKEQFIQSPLRTEFPDRIYRTGDLGYINDEGLLVFSSRKDSQIKHMGHRVELGEVETAVNSIEFVDVACCLFQQETEKIYCFYQAEEECKSKIVKALSRMIPKYMWPDRYVHFTSIPLNSHSKIDRTRLKNEYFKK